MKIYTKQGDDGNTGLIGGQRVTKDDTRIEAYGTLDELSAAIGMARSVPSNPPTAELDDLLKTVQDRLFAMGAELASSDAGCADTCSVTSSQIDKLEAQIDAAEATLPELKNFVLPGGSPLAAALHWARVVSRRAERRVVTLMQQAPVAPEIIIYLNRLSDLLFVLSRQANHRSGIGDVVWESEPATDAPSSRSSNSL